MIGGVRTNTWGETNIRGLFATGEVACTGVHGANRLASNSLLEAIVFSKRIIERTQDPERHDGAGRTGRDNDVVRSLGESPVPEMVPAPSLPALQQLNWDYVGIVRDREGLEQATGVLCNWQNALPEPVDQPSHELHNLVVTGRLMAEAALLREESRGAHFRTDFPDAVPAWQRHIIWRKS